MENILNAIKKRLDQFAQGTAYAIEKSDWRTVCRNIGLTCVGICGAFAILILFLALLEKIWMSFLGKIITTLVGMPLVLYVLWSSYKMNQADLLARYQENSADIDLAAWAENVYEYVQDAMFLVFRSVSEYTNIVTPSRASAIEFVDNPYSIEDGYVIFRFLAKTCGTIDITQFKTDVQRTLRQMHRAHELNGISRDLIEINGAYYCPLQILGNPKDFGEYVQVSVVFATEQTIKLAGAHKLLNLDKIKHTGKQRASRLTDDEL